MERYPLLVMPVSSLRPVPLDYDRQGGRGGRAHADLASSMLGLPGLAVATGHADGVPVGVQLVANRFREESASRPLK